MKAAGLPVTRAVAFAKQVNRDRDFVEPKLAGDPAHTIEPARGPYFRSQSLKDCGWGSTLAEGQVGITAAVRQAKLRPECADRYPTLPARMWTSAALLAELVASYQGAPRRPEKARKGRALPETDFEFRGGSPAGWAVDHPHPHW